VAVALAQLIGRRVVGVVNGAITTITQENALGSIRIGPTLMSQCGIVGMENDQLYNIFTVLWIPVLAVDH